MEISQYVVMAGIVVIAVLAYIGRRSREGRSDAAEMMEMQEIDTVLPDSPPPVDNGVWVPNTGGSDVCSPSFDNGASASCSPPADTGSPS